MDFVIEYLLIWGFIPKKTFGKEFPVLDYMLNPAAMQSVFMVPAEAVKSYIKLASAEQLRVLLYTMSNISSGIDTDKCAEALGIPRDSVTDALNFWCDAGVFTKSGSLSFQSAPEKRKTAKTETAKPSREEIAMMGAADENVVFLLREAELKFKRPLRFTEMQSLVSLYADYGMDVALILMIVEYSLSEGKISIKTIVDTAYRWQSLGIDTVVAAEEEIERMNRKKSAFGIILRAFGLEYRQPSSKELEYSEKWVIEWGFKADMLKAAYDACIDANAKISMPYINKILEGWHTKGIKTPEDVKAPREKAATPQRKTSYDKELFKKMLDRDD